jgi:hypothetical protein
MNPIFARCLAPFAPPQSEVHRLTDDDWRKADAIIARKKVEGDPARELRDAQEQNRVLELQGRL